MKTTPDTILDYWFGPAPAKTPAELGAKLRRWFGNAQVAQEIRERFADVVEAAVAGELTEWEKTDRGTLALIVVLDQFTRSMYGMDARAYAGDQRAIELSLRLLDRDPQSFNAEERQMAVMPLGHSERISIVQRARAEANETIARAPEALRPLFAISIEQVEKFIGVLEQFGRFPHRNEALGRESTPDEVVFLETWAERHPPRNWDAKTTAA